VGEFAAEVITAIGVGDIDIAVKILEQNDIRREAIEAITRRASLLAQETNSLRSPTQKYLVQLDDALEEVAEKGANTSKTVEMLEDIDNQLEGQLTRLTRQAQEDAASRMMEQQAQLLATTRRAVQETLNGNPDSAKTCRKVVEKLQESTDDAVTLIQRRADVLQDVTVKSGQVDDVTTRMAREGDPAIRVPRDPNTTVGASGDPDVTVRVAHDQDISIRRTTDSGGIEATTSSARDTGGGDPNVTLLKPLDPPRPLYGPNITYDPEFDLEVQRLAREGLPHVSSLPPQKMTPCLRQGAAYKDLEFDTSPLTREADAAMRRGDYGTAERLYRTLRTSEVDPTTIANVTRKQRLAHFAGEKAAAIHAAAGRQGSQVDKVMRDFTPDELARVRATPDNPRFYEQLKQSNDHVTKTAPYLIKDAQGNAIGVFKPNSPLKDQNLVDVKSERLFYRMARDLKDQGFDINIPASTGMTMTIGGKKLRGTYVRYIPGGTDLFGQDIGSCVALKRQIAQDRVLSAWMGDVDRHGGNFFLTGRGDFFSIDHGNARIYGSPGALEMDADDFDMLMRVEVQRIATTIKNYDPIMATVDRQITYDDMSDLVEAIQEMPESRIRTMVREVLGLGNQQEIDGVMRCLMTRRQFLADELSQAFPPLVATVSR